MHLKISSAKRRPFCPGGDELVKKSFSHLHHLGVEKWWKMLIYCYLFSNYFTTKSVKIRYGEWHNSAKSGAQCWNVLKRHMSSSLEEPFRYVPVRCKACESRISDYSETLSSEKVSVVFAKGFPLVGIRTSKKQESMNLKNAYIMGRNFKRYFLHSLNKYLMFYQSYVMIDVRWNWISKHFSKTNG